MSDIVHVRHPVPLRYVPRRGTKERVVFASHETPVRLRRVEMREMERIGPLNGGERWESNEYFAHGGRLWLQLDGRRADDLGPPIDGAGFAAYLANAPGAAQRAAGTCVYKSVMKSPVCATDVPGYWTRGEDFDRGNVGQMLDDGTERAVEAVRRYLAEDVLLAGERVFVRNGGPLLAPTKDSHPRWLVIHDFPRFSTQAPLKFLACRLDQAAEYWRWRREAGFVHERHMDEEVETSAQVRLVPPALLDDSDLAYCANALPLAVAGEIRDALKRLPEVPEAVGAALRALHPWICRSQISAIGGEDVEEVLELSGQAVAAMRGAGLVGTGSPLDVAGSFVTGFLLPRLRDAAPVPAEDDAAFSSLGP